MTPTPRLGQRFSKASFTAHIQDRQAAFETAFTIAEHKPLDRSWGTAQCTTSSGRGAYEAWQALENLIYDIDEWGRA
jgi:hypothetical protein